MRNGKLLKNFLCDVFRNNQEEISELSFIGIVNLVEKHYSKSKQQ